MRPQDQNCENCFYAEGLDQSQPYIECHRYPANRGTGRAGEWSLLKRDDWCGEWKAEPGPTKK